MGTGELGWTPDVFWSSTLPDLLMAYRGYRERQKESYLRAGTIAAQIINVNRDPQKRHDPYGAEDFFPFLLTDKERFEKDWGPMTPDEDDN